MVAFARRVQGWLSWIAQGPCHNFNHQHPRPEIQQLNDSVDPSFRGKEHLHRVNAHAAKQQRESHVAQSPTSLLTCF